MNVLTISELKAQTNEQLLTAQVDVQLQEVVAKTTKSGSPYIEVIFADASGHFTLKIWENKPQFQAINNLKKSAFLRLTGDWSKNKYGIDAVRWDLRVLTNDESQKFLTGDPILFKKQLNDWETILDFLSKIQDPRLYRLSQLFLEKFTKRFRRTAAARKNHHARRGGLVEHVAQMMRSAAALSKVYTELNEDLLIVGVLLHDCGKMWENTYNSDSLIQEYLPEGELIGHIPKGIELCNTLWNEMLCEPIADNWGDVFPETEKVRIHLLHLIISHHGQYDYGSPTLPKTPEAFILHYVDNIDAKFEMLINAYQSASEIGDGIYERQFPLTTNTVEPLHKFPKPKNNTPSELAEPISDQQVKEEKDDNFENIEEILETKPFNGELF